MFAIITTFALLCSPSRLVYNDGCVSITRSDALDILAVFSKLFFIPGSSRKVKCSAWYRLALYTFSFPLFRLFLFSRQRFSRIFLACIPLWSFSQATSGPKGTIIISNVKIIVTYVKHFPPRNTAKHCLARPLGRNYIFMNKHSKPRFEYECRRWFRSGTDKTVRSRQI